MQYITDFYILYHIQKYHLFPFNQIIYLNDSEINDVKIDKTD